MSTTVLPHQFLGWIHREGCVSNKAFNTYGEARRLGEGDKTIIRITKNDSGGNEMTIWKREDQLKPEDFCSKVIPFPPKTPEEQIGWLKAEVMLQTGCSESDLDNAMSQHGHVSVPNQFQKKILALEDEVSSLMSEVNDLCDGGEERYIL